MENNLYDVDIIIKKCDSIDDKKKFVEYVSEIIKEKQKSFLYQLYSIMKKDFIVKTLEKTLRIMNEGGIKKNGDGGDGIRSVGGTFIHLVKNSDLISKETLKIIFWRNKKKKEMKRKLCKALKNLSLNGDDIRQKKTPRTKIKDKPISQ